MELHLSQESEGKLVAAADRRGVSVEVLAREALERAVDYDDWFLREVETGLAQIDAGQTLTHDAVGDAPCEEACQAQRQSLMQLRWTEAATADLERIADYLFAQAPDRASRVS